MSLFTDQTDRAGIHAVGALFTRLNWAFREQSTSDYGIDAQAEKLNPDGKAGGRLIALQIKSGASYFRKRGDGYVFYGEQRHRDYWTNHSLPVFLILHDPTTGLTLWQRVADHLIDEGENGRWSIQMPANQTLDETSEPLIAAGVASDLASLRRARLALDIDLIREFASRSCVYMRIEDWVNKSFNFRSVDATFSEDPEGEADIDFDVGMAAYTVDYFMAVAFPWLDWREENYIDADVGGGEVALHVLKVKVSAVGFAAITLDDFYKTSLPEFRPAPVNQLMLDDRENEWDARDL